MRPFLEIENLQTALEARGLRNLFHANAVETAVTYFKLGKLLSRQALISGAYPQAFQSSDRADEKLNLISDLFLNFHDSHTRFRRPNEYGPITFSIKVDRLFAFLKCNGAKVSITKTNPIHWGKNDTIEDRWFASVEEFETAFQGGRDQAKSSFFNGATVPDLVISDLDFGIPLTLVDEIIVERNPELLTLREDFEAVIRAVGHSSMGKNLKPVWRRSCAPSCSCNSISSYLKTNVFPKFHFGKWAAQIQDTRPYDAWLKRG